MINVTKTYLPDRDKYKKYVDRIFDSGWLTNNGQMVRELEKSLCEYLGVENLLVVANGTLALQIAYRVLGIRGKVITTPFTFVATASSMVWEGIEPQFADIDSDTFNISRYSIEKKITGETTAIVPVHVFGNACDIDEIEKLAKENDMKLLFDAAHSFGVKYKGTSILNFGDASILSFHSTKIFHTIEGGAIIFSNKKHLAAARKMINFGITGYDRVEGIGINGKMNEFQAAMGLCLLDDIDSLISRRKEIYGEYVSAFSGEKKLKLQKLNPEASYNYSYFPLVFSSEETREKIYKLLIEQDIFARRYFSPSLDTLGYIYSDEMPVSRSISGRILCLPMYEDLPADAQRKIIHTVLSGIQDK